MATDIRIDLRQHGFTPEVQEMLAAGATMVDACPLEEEPLLAQACAEAGLDDFGEDSFRVPLRVLLHALDTEAGLSDMGRVATHTQLLQLMKQRLLVEHTITEHPEILDLEIDRPIIIAGLPRTGTTHLQNLLAADPNLRSLPYWESLEPVPPLDEAGRTFAVDPRIERSDAALAFLDQARPHFRAMFDIGTHHAHEEINLLAIDISTMYFETLAPMPSWRAFYREEDQTPHYAYLERVLKVLQFLRPHPQQDGGGTRWLLKSPQHLEQFGPMMAVFPDATVLVTHRDPVAVVASVATMLSYVLWLSHERPDPERIGRYWFETVAEMLDAAVRDRHLLPADQSVDVRFHEYMADQWAVVERSYATADQPLGPATSAALHAYLDDHQRGRHGRLRYDLADFALDEGEMRERFAAYVERFGVALEPIGG